MANDKSRLRLGPPLSFHTKRFFSNFRSIPSFLFRRYVLRTFHKGGREAIDYFSECLSLVTIQSLSPFENNCPFLRHGPIRYSGTHFSPAHWPAFNIGMGLR
ncbi:hypothetical protein CEXT_792071 [Caerostris extrusa]|uniref:Uncharacterized protein n=1 Tax=Caerostris extrusa TaxID=172846 RepID=A0AAV4TA40_CAEEX|nr:hypothetical protein CEXT_792071 [Caerostris extrusa]